MTKSVLQDGEWLSQSLAPPVLRMMSDIKYTKGKKQPPCRNKGKKAMKKTKKIEVMQRLIQSKTGIRL